jgi:hypothetical protein
MKWLLNLIQEPNSLCKQNIFFSPYIASAFLLSFLNQINTISEIQHNRL